MKIRNPFKGLSKTQWIIYLFSLTVVTVSSILGGVQGLPSVIASALGVTSLIFTAKGDVFGPLLMVIFSIMYGVISYSYAYYGEVITYLGMTAPISAVSVFTWLKNPYEKGKHEVKIARLKKIHILFLTLLTCGVTFIFYYILLYFNTANMLFSTLSIATSFFAVGLTTLRSPYYAIAYGLNDVVLIILWCFASFEDRSYISMIVCFVMFLINDIYGFVNWKRMERKQKAN
ncbi:MAG: nicotinamide riboside transporter PnuC [Ruminococcus sp.]|nr:nicotinamide riboside transporter PnuC [Ruminococcus sp.]